VVVKGACNGPCGIQILLGKCECTRGLFKLLILVHEKSSYVLAWTFSHMRDRMAIWSTMHFWTVSASRVHFATAYSLTTCFLVFTTQSAKVRFRALSDMLGMLSGRDNEEYI
jgi:hypothetical protein